MEAIILAGGKGSRLGIQKNKSEILADNHTLMQHHCKQLQPYIKKAYIVEGFYSINRSHITLPFELLSNSNGVISAIQHALRQAEDDCILIFGDEYADSPNYSKMIKEFYDSDSIVTLGYVTRKQNTALIHDTYSLELSSNRVLRIVEKPTTLPNCLQGTAYSIISKSFEKYLNEDTRAYPNSIQLAIDNGEVVTAVDFANEFFNVNTPRELSRMKVFLTKNC
jgi:molybdopterin-guanine dinucleotide biosynthesis protein A